MSIHTSLKNKKESMIDLIYVLSGCLILAFAISSILTPNGIVTGGVTGLSIILSHVISIEYTIIYYVLTLFVLLLAFVFLGKKDGFKIIGLSIVFPFILMVFDFLNIQFIQQDLFLASVYYGIFAGVGVGLMLKRGYSMGGSDTLAKILHNKIFPFISLSQIMMAIDMCIIATSIFVFDINVALYALITQFVFKKTVDIVMFGFGNQKVKLEIISQKSVVIEEFILHEISRGVTSYHVKGGYTNDEKVKLMTICTPRESSLIKSFIAENDKKAFVTVIPVSSVWGEGVGFDTFE